MFAWFFIGLVTAIDLVDVRYGSYRLGEFIASETQSADEIRIIFELNDSPEYTILESDGKLAFTMLDVHSGLHRNEYAINNGLISIISLKQVEQSLVATIFFEGTYQSHSIEQASDPVRLVLKLKGEPILEQRKTPEPQVTKKADDVGGKPVIRRVGAARQSAPAGVQAKDHESAGRMDDSTLAGLFPENSTLNLDLNEVPIQQVLRFFSQRSRYDIVQEGALDGLVTLSIENQRLTDAFRIVLESQGLTGSMRGDALVVSARREPDPATAYTLYTVYLRDIDVLDMKVALDYFLPENHFILPDRRINKLDIYLPDEQITLVDSLVAQYDTPVAETEFSMQTLFLDRDAFDQIDWNGQGACVVASGDFIKIPAKKDGDILKGSFEIHQQEYCRQMKRKAFKTGIPVFSSSRVVLTTGYEMLFELHVGNASHYSLKTDITWHIVSPDLVQTDDRIRINADIDHGEVLLVYNNLYFPHNSKYDDWLQAEADFKSDRIPVLAITPL